MTAINHISSAYPPQIGDASGRIRFVTVDRPQAVDEIVREVHQSLSRPTPEMGHIYIVGSCVCLQDVVIVA
jgi:hypothetical protein